MKVYLTRGAEGLSSIFDIKPFCLCLPILVFWSVRKPERLTYLCDIFNFQKEVFYAFFVIIRIEILKISR